MVPMRRTTSSVNERLNKVDRRRLKISPTREERSDSHLLAVAFFTIDSSSETWTVEVVVVEEDEGGAFIGEVGGEAAVEIFVVLCSRGCDASSAVGETCVGSSTGKINELRMVEINLRTSSIICESITLRSMSVALFVISKKTTAASVAICVST